MNTIESEISEKIRLSLDIISYIKKNHFHRKNTIDIIKFLSATGECNITLTK